MLSSRSEQRENAQVPAKKKIIYTRRLNTPMTPQNEALDIMKN